jgi:uncharacterized protein (TIGR02996 family)
MKTTTTPFTPRAAIEAAFIKAIAENPADLDGQAKVYADWLEDQGLDDEAAFVRAEEPPYGYATCKVVREYRHLLLKRRCPAGIKRERIRLSHADLDGADPRRLVLVDVRHGFVVGWAGTWPQFDRWAAGWFGGNPITRVRLHDHSSPMHWERMVQDERGEYVPADAGWSWDDSRLPPDLWDRLADFVQEYQSDHGNTHRHYDTSDDAERALSNACVRLGRERAGLSPRGSCST